MAGHPQRSEVSTNDQAVSFVLQLLQQRNLKDTEEVFKKELGLSTSSASSGVIRSSHIQPAAVQDSYKKSPSKSHFTACPPPKQVINIEDSEDEEEGPHSWPGTRPLPQLSSNFMKSIKMPATQAPFRAVAQKPMMYSPNFPMPTLFTIVPPSLIGASPSVSQQPTSLGLAAPSISTTVQSPVTPSEGKQLSLPSPTGNNQLKNPVTLAAIPPEEMTPAYIELKRFAEEFKTKRIQLGYTQGAVGQSLADRGYNNFAQSTISRFEQMQLSPSNAAAIKVVLERWLHEAENPEAVSSTTNSQACPPRKRKKRAVFSSHTRNTLEEYFAKEPRPNRQIIEMIGKELDLLPEEVRVWFCNKRQKYKHHADEEVDNNMETSSDTSEISSVSSYTRATPSPTRRTKFTVEELAKSSAPSTPSAYSPLGLTSPISSLRPVVFTPGKPIMAAPFFTSYCTKA